MASFKEKRDKDGNLVFQVQASDGRGRRVYRTFRPQPTWSAKTTRRELQKFASGLENELKAGTVLTKEERRELARREKVQAARIQTLRQYVEGVWMPQKRASSAQNTVKTYESVLRLHILPELGDFLLTEVSSAQLTALFYDMQAEYSPNTLNLVRTVLGMVFKAAVQDDILDKDPMQKARFPKAPKDAAVEKPLAYTADELRRILEAVRQEPLTWQALVLLMAGCGLRRGEALGLQWDCVGFETGLITVKRNLQPTTGGTYTVTPKSGRERVVQAPPALLEMLGKIKADQPVTVRWCFARRYSTEPLHPCGVTRHFGEIGEKYGIPDFHPHKLRHTFASIAIEQGADVAAVAQCLGHAQIQTTLQTYVHTNQAAANRAASKVWQALETPQADAKQA